VLNKFYDWVCLELNRPKKTLMYRDLQSSNIYLNNNIFYYIDFQDARLGIPHYDLAALLWDAYVPLNTNTRLKLVNYYKKISGTHNAGFNYYLQLCLLQRKLHDAGAFANAVKHGKKHFKVYIKPAVNIALAQMRKLPECKNALEIMNNIVRKKR